MKKLLPLIFVTLLLAGCASQGSTKMTDDQIFQKKQECAKYREEVEKQNKQYNSSWSDSNGEVREFSTIEELFYSPVVNSCVYTQTKKLQYNDEKGKIETNYRFLIIDGLTNELIRTSSMFVADVYDLRETEFKQKIKELKAE